MKRLFLTIIFFMAIVTLNGCHTISDTSRGFGEGVVKDIKALWQGINKADKWFSEHAW